MVETGRDDVLGLPLSGVDAPRGERPTAVDGRKGDCDFNADPGRYVVADCCQAVLGRPNSINAL